ncbi:hypothetical protein [Desulfocurvibacter africanus]|uniref:Uncharacterized protein n=1 Tax=Desulfocurvibacter africanus subsp. africanus str. Walvis Bay TaxID=690850 RepID=F3Z3M2_DESAF|nr:hypothetical protein [Desulfocurvibacter africanus]EGJ50394.1 hypothetical protein Desaf_2065 [Desulfocurvibacter africanus subsp. africanus str. Walvis Bay]
MKSIIKRIALLAGSVTCAATLCLGGQAFAQDSSLPDQEQVAEAEQQADQEMTASQQQIRSALQQLQAAEVQLNRVRAKGDEQQLEQAQAAYDKAVADANTAINREGVDVGAMRTSGMGWGEIAHTAGLHPAALAFGKAKKQASAPEETQVKADKAHGKMKQSKEKASKTERVSANKAKDKSTVSADKFGSKKQSRAALSGDNGLSSGGNMGGKGGNGNGGGKGNSGGKGGGNGGGNGNGGGKGRG